jgi:hypothetical protein
MGLPIQRGQAPFPTSIVIVVMGVMSRRLPELSKPAPVVRQVRWVAHLFECNSRESLEKIE